MGRIGKNFVLFLTLIIAMPCLTILTVKPASAQSVTAPSVPQFTVKFVNASYSVTTANAYTGQNETQQVSNNSIEVTIKNQQFGYSNNGLTYQIYFNVRVEPHFLNTDNWTEVYPLENLTSSQANENGFPYAWYVLPETPSQSNQDYTTFAFPVIPTEVYGASGYDVLRADTGHNAWLPDFLDAIPSGAQLDFQVQALVGHNSTYWYIQHPFTPTIGGYSAPAVAYDTASGWSNRQTITIGQTTSTSPTPTPSVPELSWLVILPLLLSIFLVTIMYRHRKTANWKQ
jgi:hypothetical protein